MRRSGILTISLVVAAAGAAAGLIGRPYVERWLEPPPEVHIGLCEEVVKLHLQAPSTYRLIAGAGFARPTDYLTSVSFEAKNPMGVPLQDVAICTFDLTTPAGMLPRMRTANISGEKIGPRALETDRFLAESAWHRR